MKGAAPNGYLQGLEECKVRSLEHIIEFNKEHAEEELPDYHPSQDILIDTPNINVPQATLSHSSVKRTTHLLRLQLERIAMGLTCIVEMYFDGRS
ncbi:Amidase [Zalerion maritima]|uniref:Amidase n=1 Tax=Zalerion maritima TaxID=339359 RepID=A0AAD5WWH6_9PEZI|nr:Amidase [Zalerion maritima]